MPLGQKTKAHSTPVTMASDQEPLRTTEAYVTNDVDESVADTTYLGAETYDGDWLITRSVDTGGTLTTNRYASEANNGSISTYGSAWANRGTLAYSTFADVV